MWRLTIFSLLNWPLLSPYPCRCTKDLKEHFKWPCFTGYIHILPFRTAKVPSLGIISGSPDDLKGEWIQVSHHFKQVLIGHGDIFYCLNSVFGIIGSNTPHRVRMIFKRTRAVWPSHRDLVNTCHSSETSWGEKRKADSLGIFSCKDFYHSKQTNRSFKKIKKQYMKDNCTERNFLSWISDPSKTLLYADYNVVCRYSRSMSNTKPHLFHIQGQPFSQRKLCFAFKNLQNTVSRNRVYIYVYLKDFTF